MFRSGTPNKHRHTQQLEINKVKLTTSRLGKNLTLQNDKRCTNNFEINTFQYTTLKPLKFSLAFFF